MYYLTHRRELNPGEIKRYESGESIKDIVYDIACSSSYHPMGYGFMAEKIIEEDGKYVAVWESWNSCE